VVAGLGLSLGLAALAAPAFFAAAVPALASPLALGGIAAFLANLVTLPLVKREDRFVIPLRGASSDVIEDRTVAIGGAWGLRPETVRRIHHALMEFGDLLAGRGLREMTVGAEQVEDRVRVVVTFAGAPLPRPNRRPRATDLEAGGDALEAAALWLTVREATQHGTRATGEGQELWMEFDD
jgi:NCS2 family nucleobase:cation symporter-2